MKHKQLLLKLLLWEDVIWCITPETAICRNPPIPQTDIATLLEWWIKYTPSVTILYAQKDCFSLYFHKTQHAYM